MTISAASAVRLVHDERDQARLSLRGDLDVEAAVRLEHYVRAVLDAGARFIVLDLPGVSDHDPRVLELLSRTQRELTTREGMITAVGLTVSGYEPSRPAAQVLVAV
jgi:ABC-type transporter Mla MlaB component